MAPDASDLTEESLFQQAVGLSPTERAALLARARADRPQLRAAVESLLAAHSAAGFVLQGPVFAATRESGE